ncbi:hypothetical protein EDD18DRAFT_1466036 [Armillaria luteobubalina]|nr:hypothetical protein EDD18DRAFT_1466036 [Armillaria luteobubalina]
MTDPSSSSSSSKWSWLSSSSDPSFDKLKGKDNGDGEDDSSRRMPYSSDDAKGVTGVYVVIVNDQFVMDAWKEKLAPKGTPIHFLADDQGEFAGATGLIFDATSLLGGPRSKI